MESVKRATQVAALMLATASVTLIGSRLLDEPVWADDGVAAAGVLIDKDWEVALRKHVEKRFFRMIDASDEQRKEIDGLLSSTQEATRPEREELREGLVKLTDLISGDATDDQIQAKVLELRALHQKIMDQRVETVLKVRGTLSADQKKNIGKRLTALLTGDGKHSLKD